MRTLILLLAVSSVGAEPARRLGFDGFRVGACFQQAELSPDGRTFAVRAESSVYLLDAGTGATLQRWDGLGEIVQMGFTFEGHLLVLNQKGTLRRFDLRTGHMRSEVALPTPNCTWASFQAQGRFVRGLFSPNPDELASVTQAILDTSTGRAPSWAGKIPLGTRWRLSADGRWLAISHAPDGKERRLRLIQTTDGKVLFQRPPHATEPDSLAFTPDGNTLLVNFGARVIVIDVASGQERDLTLEDPPQKADFLHQAALSSDGRRLASTEILPQMCTESVVREWDLASGKLLVRSRVKSCGESRLAYLPAGRLWLWNPHDCRLNVTDLHGSPLLPGSGHRSLLCSLAFSADGQEIVSRDMERLHCRWDVTTGRLLESRQERELQERWAIIGPLGDNQKVPALLDQSTRRQVPLPECEDLWPSSHRVPVMPVFSRDGRFLAEWLRSGLDAGCEPARQMLVVYKAAGLKRMGRIPLEIGSTTGPVLFSPEADWVLVSHDFGATRFDLRTGRLLQVLRPSTPAGCLVPLAVSPDGRHLIVWSSETRGHGPCELRLIELATGTARRTWLWSQSPPEIALPCFSPDGRTIAMPLEDCTILLLSTASAAPTPDRSTLWRDLASPDAAIAGAAVDVLREHPDFPRWLRGRQKPEADEPDLPALFWLAELEHDEPRRRETARRQLARRPELLREVETALVGRPNPDLAQSLAAIRDEIASPTPPCGADLRRLRIAELLHGKKDP